MLGNGRTRDGQSCSQLANRLCAPAKLFQEIGVNGFRVADLDEIRAFESQFRNYVDGRVRDSFNADLSELAHMSDERINAVVEQTYRDAWDLFVTWGDRE